MDIEALFPLVRPFVKGCPSPTLTAALRRAARRLCSDSWYATRTLTLDVEAGVAVYQLVPPGDEEVLNAKDAQYQDTPLVPAQAAAARPGQSGTPRGFFFRPPRSLFLLPTPDADVADALRVLCPVQPTATATTIPDAVGTHYDRALADGALAWLLAMPSEQWTDRGEASKRELLFGAATADARRKALRAHMPRGFMLRPRQVAL